MESADRETALWLFLSFALLYLLTSGGHFYASDDVQKLAVLDALFKHGSFAIPDGWMPGLNGLRYSWFPLGASLLMLPGWLAGHAVNHLLPGLPTAYVEHFCVSLQNSPISAVLVVSAYGVARATAASRAGAAFASVAMGLGTMVWPYAKTAWSEPAATLVIFLGVAAIARAERENALAPAWLLGAGALFATSVFIRQEFLLIPVAAALWLAWQHRRTPGRLVRAIAVFLAPVVGIGLVCLWYNQMRYGVALSFPNYHLPQNNLVMEEGRFGWSLKNIYQYTLSPNQGLVWYSPPVLLGLWGLPAFNRLHPRLVKLALASLVPMALFYVYGWGLSSWAWGLRYSYVFVPFLLLPAARLWDHASARGRGVCWAVLAWGALVQLLGVSHDFIELYSRTMASEPGLTIQGIMTHPRVSPLWLALRDMPQLVANGLYLLARPVAPVRDIARYHVLRGELPDLWPLLQLLGPVPRAVVGAVTGALALGFLYSVARLYDGLRRAPAARLAEGARGDRPFSPRPPTPNG